MLERPPQRIETKLNAVKELSYAPTETKITEAIPFETVNDADFNRYEFIESGKFMQKEFPQNQVNQNRAKHITDLFGD